MRWRTGVLPTDRQYTGQRWDEALGLYDDNVRYYDPALGRFIQPDTLVPEPGNPQALNRLPEHNTAGQYGDALCANAGAVQRAGSSMGRGASYFSSKSIRTTCFPKGFSAQWETLFRVRDIAAEIGVRLNSVIIH